MKRSIALAVAIFLVGSVPLLAGAAPKRVVHRDADDSPGRLDLESVSWRVKATGSGHRFIHTLRTKDTWAVEEFYVWMYLYEHDPDFSKCYPDRCSGLWEGEIYWDAEQDELVAYLREDSIDCGDCGAIPIRAWKVDDRTMAFSIPEGLFYPDSTRYDAEFETFWRDPLHMTPVAECRVSYCTDDLPDEGTVPFPIVHSRDYVPEPHDYMRP